MKRVKFLIPLFASIYLAGCSIILPNNDRHDTPYNPGTGYLPSTYQNLSYRNVNNINVIPTVANPKILVIPVWFQDSGNFIATASEKQTYYTRIQKAFFGSNEETGWYSVSSYYKEESYNQTILGGTVSDWYNAQYTYNRFLNDDGSSSKTCALVREATDWYFNNNDDARTNYDADRDGYLDGVVLIYAAPDYTKLQTQYKNLWAYVYWQQRTELKNVTNPGVNAFLWASYDFMDYDTNHCHIDTHTYIHETGHLFGLEDYYDQNKPAGVECSSSGGFSMQDFNVGGHDPYSIYALGWTTPTVATKTERITINPFVTTGDCIVLSPTDSKSAFDEYLLLELYVKYGVNDLDASFSYRGGYPKGPILSGVRIWHVDARLATPNQYARYDEAHVTNAIAVNTEFGYRHACSNVTYSEAYKSYCSPIASFRNYRLLDLIRADDTNHARVNNYVTNSDLFRTGDTFSMSEYSNCFVNTGLMNSGEALGYEIRFVSVSTTKAVIDITKLS